MKPQNNLVVSYLLLVISLKTEIQKLKTDNE